MRTRSPLKSITSAASHSYLATSSHTSYQGTCRLSPLSFFFFNDTATTEIYTLSLHDALPISARTMPATADYLVRASLRFRGFRSRFITTRSGRVHVLEAKGRGQFPPVLFIHGFGNWPRSEEHTSELQSHSDLVCRLLLEKKKT